jgi:large subunit ribosomal protein L17
MRHNQSGRRLNRTAPHRKMLKRNLVTALFEHERIETTVVKAKEARSLAEKLITYAKRGDLHGRRMAARKLNDPAILQKLFEEIGPRYAERPGGYTRILRLSGARRGDNAEMALLELVDNTARPKSLDSQKRRRARRILQAEEKAEAEAARQETPAETAPEEAPAEEVDETAAEETTAEAAPEATAETTEEPTAEPDAEPDADTADRPADDGDEDQTRKQ